MDRIEVPGYLTPDEARAAGVPWHPSYRLETERDRLSAATVRLTDPGRNIPEYGWLCKICARRPVKDSERWSWLACRTCREVDARLARQLGGKRLLPLGMHSIMNGAGIPLSTPQGPELTAMFERVITMSKAWDLIDQWAKAEFGRLAADAIAHFEEPPTSIPLAQWLIWFPPGSQASGDAYSRMLTEHYPTLVEAVPLAGDARWLGGGSHVDS